MSKKITEIKGETRLKYLRRLSMELNKSDCKTKLKRKKFSRLFKMDVFRKGNGICYICKKPLSADNFSIDHVIPLSKGGKNKLDNMMPTHINCNNLKADKLISEM